MAVARALVYGGKGALGSAIVSHFKANNWWVASLDLFPSEEADANVIITATDSWTDQANEVGPKVTQILEEGKVDMIVCVAGGWAGGNASVLEFVKNSDMMWKQSVWSSIIAAQLASHHLKEGGILVLTGAKAALEGTPGMIGYGMAKAAVHHLIKSLAVPAGGLPAKSTVLGILPVTLDTPMNRKFMSDADFNQWTPLDVVASKLLEWANGNRPNTGTLVQIITTDGKTDFIPV